MLSMVIDETTPIKEPMTSNHTVIDIPLGKKQVRQDPPAGVLALFSARIVTDWLVDVEGLSW